MGYPLRINATDYDVSTLVHALHEVIFIREGLLSLSNEYFNCGDINTLIQLLATQPLDISILG